MYARSPLLVTLSLFMTLSVQGAARRPQERLNGDAFAAFRRSVAEYVELQRRLRLTIPRHAPVADPAALSQATDALANAVINARPHARQGDFFDRRAADEIRVRMNKMLAGTSVTAFLADLNDEPTFTDPPRVHLRYPKGTSMAMMPKRVLDVLPELPQGLEYRFVQRDLVLRDSDAELILDYVTNALPGK